MLFKKTLFRKKKKYNVPKKAYEYPFKYRFTFVPKNCSYYEGYTVQVSDKISTLNKAYFYAVAILLDNHKDVDFDTVAVFYGDTEAPDCMDKLYRAYSSLDKIKKKLRR